MLDAYSRWLEIPDHLRPPTHYELLGISPSETDRTSIAVAAERQLLKLRPHSSGPDREICERIENELILARNTLLDPLLREAYDIVLKSTPIPWWKPDAATPTVPGPVDEWWKPMGSETNDESIDSSIHASKKSH